jgi:uncharacterized cupredoxin-like copper-binding protein
MKHRLRSAPAATATLVLVFGCGGGSSGYGKPGDATKADRTVEIRQGDPFRFEPTTLSVKPGETVTFTVTNTGSQLHEFVIGDGGVQDDHDKEMKDMGSGSMKMADTPNALDLDPGETKTLTWTFPAKGTVIFGCHVPGHYEGGMKGTITVS